MRIIFVKIFFLLFISVGAHGTDTLFFNQKWKPVKGGKRFTFYAILKSSATTNTVHYYYKKGFLYAMREFKDSTFQNFHGKSIWFDGNDTATLENWVDNKLKMSVVYEKNLPYEIKQFVNDTTTYKYTVAAKNYYSSKTLYSGDLIYHFYGKDSVLFLNSLRYAFHRKIPSADFCVFKFKVLPWVVAEDAGMIYSLGFEYTLRRIHSVELQLSYVDWDQDQEDNYGNPLPSIYNVRRSAQIGYRYYLPVKNIKYPHRFFISPFIRYGRWRDFYAEGAVTDYFKNISNNYTAGLLFGINTFPSSSDDGQMYTEFFIGPQFVYRETEQGLTLNNVSVENNFITSRFGIRFGLNFCFLWKRKNSK